MNQKSALSRVSLAVMSLFFMLSVLTQPALAKSHHKKHKNHIAKSHKHKAKKRSLASTDKHKKKHAKKKHKKNSRRH